MSVRRPEQGYKLLVSVESRNDEGRAWWSRKDTLAVCVTILSLRGERGPMDAEKGGEGVPLMFGCGKACVVRVGPLAIRCAVDWNRFGGRERMSFWRQLFMKRKRNLRCGS